MLKLRGTFGPGAAETAPAVPAGWCWETGPGFHLQYEPGHPSCTVRRDPTGVVIGERHLIQDQPSDPARRDGSWLELRWTPAGMEIITDRLGTIPVHWAVRGRTFYFATRLADVARLLPGAVEPDPAAVLTTIFLDHPWGSRTLLRDVHLLPPASRCRILGTGADPVCDRYWLPPVPEVGDPGSVEPWLEAATERLRQAHVRHAADLDPETVAMPVTAGLDSRCNLALHPDLALCARLFHCHDLANVEWPYARRIGRHLRRPIERFDSADDMRHAPGFNPDLGPGDFNIGHWRLVGTARRLAATGSRATVDGFLQDLLFKATFLREQSREQQIQGHLARLRYNAAALGFGPDSPQVRRVEECIREDFPAGDTGLEASQRHYLENRSRRLVYNIVRLNQNYLDVRTPALDHALMDFALALPWQLRKGSWLYRRIIQRLSPELAGIPYDKTGLPLLSPRPRSLGKATARQLRPFLNRVWPGRQFFQPPEGNFARLARHDPLFRATARGTLSSSEWLRAILATDSPEDVLRTPRNMGPQRIDCLGGMLTASRLESATRQSRQAATAVPEASATPSTGYHQGVLP